ncbi:MAG TPA: ATP-dependent DNA helicase RecG, partial [Verrucomicrobiae bacterium]|nr:ATP-dependent DNA helicase RecG [Verrucomicrobiae bacterium]
ISEENLCITLLPVRRFGEPQFDSSVTTLLGVGPDRARLLEKLGIRTVQELLLHRPRRYEDRRVFQSIGDINALGAVTVEGEVVEVGVKRFGRGMKSLTMVIIDDGTGRLHCRWWNLPQIAKNFYTGQRLLATGRLRDLKPRTIDHPEIEAGEKGEDESIHARRIVPVYPLTEGVSQRWLRGLIWRVLESGINIPENYAKELFLARPGYGEAIRMLHFPKEMHETIAARERLALEEFLVLQIEIQTRRKNLENKAPRLVCPGDNHLIKKFLPLLGYELTGAQTKVLREIRQDLARGIPMRRLLQGDVGSGKTVVAGCSALMALESGKSVALMAPTEILAEQHFKNFSRWFRELGVPVKIWTGGSKSDLSGRVDLLGGKTGPMLVIGTHALIQRSFALPGLGLVIIDEQHRFGVAQREQLVRKGQYPHLLVMTATPIPRTLGLTLYGDLDLSLLDEMPAGRKPIQTFVRGEEKLPKVWEFVRDHLIRGEQAYVVYARVEDESSGKAVIKEVEKLRAVLRPLRVEALHGRMSGEEKEAIMREFAANRIHALVASSVIEVGVDVPNATIMVIENAEQFGLAQLHQLRGRVGRGAKQSYCILISPAKNDVSAERLKTLEQSNDGFKIAEADLKFRGPGDFLGHEQSGIPNFRFGDLQTDFDLLIEARQIARQLLAAK